jgi:hypothetical protein
MSVLASERLEGGAPRPIERVDPISAAEFEARFERPGIPVIIQGGARSSPAVERFSTRYLKERLGAIAIPWKLSSSHKHPNFCEKTIPKMFARERGTMAELLDHITTGPVEERSRRLFTGDEQFLMRRRDGQIAVDPDLAPLLEDVDVPALVPQDRLYTVWAWFSGAGVRTWLHYDNNGCHNLNAQLTGEKECVLISPHELRRVYPFPLGGGNPATNCSQVDVEVLDTARFPEFAAASRWEGRLCAGDLLFIPAWWWHTFLHVGALNSNVNFWWSPNEEMPNPTARRQALLDLIVRAKVAAATNAPEGAVREALDEAAIDDPDAD